MGSRQVPAGRPEKTPGTEDDFCSEDETNHGFQAQSSNLPTDVAVQLENVSVWYGNLSVLRKVSLSFRRKSTTVVMGPSGCGKTTLIRVLNRMNDGVPGFKLSGNVRLNGTDIYSKEVDPIELKTRVGMVFQKPNPFPFSVYDNVAFGPRIHGLAKDRPRLDDLVRTSLEKAALWNEVKDRLGQSATKLSGGQQQRLCIARALALKPEVLLLDEPTASLDPGATTKIEELITELEREYTVVLVTHDMLQAARVADAVAFLYKGEVVEFGSSPEIFENPKNKLTEDYIRGRLI
jgi:phosphate transport system ATP-binding protein